jgi:hypothetical protein
MTPVGATALSCILASTGDQFEETVRGRWPVGRWRSQASPAIDALRRFLGICWESNA